MFDGRCKVPNNYQLNIIGFLSLRKRKINTDNIMVDPILQSLLNLWAHILSSNRDFRRFGKLGSFNK